MTAAGSTLPSASWDERLREVQRLYPSAADPTWLDALGDFELMGAVLRDALRVGHTPKRRGSRPLLNAEDGEVRLRQLFGDDYTTLPFAEAFRVLVESRGLSVRQVARKTGLSRSHAHRLMLGQVAPTGRDMEMAASGLSKPAVYFLEYRVGLLLAAVAQHLTEAPETSVGLVRQLRRPGQT